MFEKYIEDYSPNAIYMQWKATVEGCDYDQRKMTQFESQTITGKMEVKFYGYMLVALRTLTPACNQQIFFMTHIAKYHGLSRLGVFPFRHMMID